MKLKREREKQKQREEEKPGEREERRSEGQGGGKASQNPGGTVYSAIKKQGFSNTNAHTSQGIGTADSVPS